MINDIGFIINLITLGINILTCIISFMILIIIIHHLCYNRMRQKDKLVVSLSASIYPLLLVYAAMTLLLNIQSMLGDMYGWNFDSPVCIFKEYFSTAVLSTLYWSFTNQAFFRLCRIVYSTYRCLQFSRLYIIIPPIQLSLVCILLSPVLLWHDIVYLPNEHYCFVPITKFRSILWLLFNAYAIPVFFLLLIYLRITIFLRRQSTNQTLIVKKQQQQRDLIVIRRILIIVSFLVALGIPAIVFLLILFVTGEAYPLCTRIEFFFVNLSMMGLSLLMVFITPQVKCVILKKFQHNQIMSLNRALTHSPSIGQNTTTL